MEYSMPCKWQPKESNVAIFISEKIHFKQKLSKKTRRSLYEESIHQEDIKIVNMHPLWEHPNT